MKIILFNRENFDYWQDRIKKIEADTPHQWGEMDSTQMFSHLNRVFELSLNKIEDAEDRSNLFTRNFLGPLIFSKFLSWPKGKVKAAPDFFCDKVNSFEIEKENLLNNVNEFVEKSENEPNSTGLSPILGPQKLSFWQKIHGKHTNHHLEQFGA